MTEMINALLLKYKRGTARPGLGASHRTAVVTLTYHHQQIIILGHTSATSYTMGNCVAGHGEERRMDDGRVGEVGGGKKFPRSVWLWLTYLNDIHFVNVCSIVFILLSNFKVKGANIIRQLGPLAHM